MRKSTYILLVATLALAACGGGGGGTVPATGGATFPNQPPSGTQVATPTNDEASIGAADEIGSEIKTADNFNEGGAAENSMATRTTDKSGGGPTCNGFGYELIPDFAGPNSVEEKFFYDNGCTLLGRDVQRTYQISGKNENAQVVVYIYQAGSSKPMATRTRLITISGATFDSNGFAMAKDGFSRYETSSLSLPGNVSKVTNEGDELVVNPESESGTESYCGDAAGFNVTGFPNLNETFGYNGTFQNGTRSVSGGAITWAATHNGTEFKGGIGSLFLPPGVPNNACPFERPMFTLGGGTSIGNFSKPESSTYTSGFLTNFTIVNGTLPNGQYLNVQTLPGGTYATTTIVGSISTGPNNTGTQISSYNVDSFGNGTLFVDSTSNTYPIRDWSVLKK